jgi:hypothetical protein
VSRIQLFEFVPLNIRAGPARTDMRKNFFTQRLINTWKSIPASIKNSKTVSAVQKWL